MAFTRFAVLALLGMLALAAAVDVEIQKKGYKSKEPEYKEESKDYYPHPSKANVEAKHKSWDLEEKIIETFPCAEKYEILGSNVAQSAELFAEKNKNVGGVFWSGVVTQWDTCGHCKDYKAKTEHIVKVNYQVTFEFTEEHKGQLVCGVVGGSIFSDESITCAVLGGTGAFKGAWGSITWTSTGEKTGKYAFDIYLPKIHEVKDKDSKPEKDDDYKY